MVGQAKETSGLTTKLILSYVADRGGPEAVATTLRHADLPHAPHELEDAHRWFSYRDKIALFDGAARALDDPDVASRVGSAALSTNVLSGLVPLFRAFGGPAPLLRQVARAQRRFSTAATMEAIEVRRSSAVLRYEVLPPNAAHHHDCRYTMGILRQIGPIFGLPDARVAHDECQVEGAAHCTYRVSWMRDLRLRSRRAQRQDAIALEAAGAIESAESRQATAAALLRLSRSLADLTTVEETAGRLAEAAVEAVGCDRASVLLWDRASGSFTTRGLSGFPVELEDAAWQVRVDPRDDDAHGLPPVDRPSCVSRSDAVGRLADLMDEFGLGHSALVPLRSRRHLLGVLNACWTTDSPALDSEDLEERLAGLADQAATALENARLLETVRRQAMHDGLTGLANQTLFADRVRQGLAGARRTGDELALAVLDLDRFKTVNDSLGHAVGDELLVEVGRRLSTCVREVDSVARMGGDEFTLLLPGPDGAVAAEQAATRVLAAFEQPFEVGGHLLRVTPSIGFAVHPGHGDELDDLLKRADAAMYEAKAAGRNTWALYTSGMSEQAYDRLTLEADLSRAVAAHELRVAYQPVVRLADGVVVGAEALVRWAHPTLGVLTPDEFVPIAEEIGIVADIDGWVLRQACLDLGRAQVAGGEPARVSVNLSGRSLTHPALAERVSAALASGGIEPGQLVLEVTETVTVEEASGVAEALAELRALGVRVAIDDFGRGYSALARLDQLPMDQLKIDKAFLDGVSGADDDAPVVSAIIAMGLGLGLEVVAEGVERPEQLDFLRSRGCDLVQGYLLGRPSSGPLTSVLRPGPSPAEGGEDEVPGRATARRAGADDIA